MSSLVVLAAGLGTRFGGVKQLVPIRPNGQAILDLLLERATAHGFGAAVVVTAPAIEDEMRAHFAVHRPPLLVEVVLQSPVPGRDRPLGTAHAVLACADAIDRPFAVVNADDLYPPDAFAMLADHLSSSDTHALVAFRVGKTVIGTRPVKRALLDIDDEDQLVAIRESTVTVGAGALRGDEWVSMNMWGFARSVFDVLRRAVDEFIAGGVPGEILLPDVVGSLVGEHVAVRVLRCEQPCIGITYAEDVDIVRQAAG